MTAFEDDIKYSLEALRNGGVILYPTDTVWGLGCDPTNPAAVDKLLNIKARGEGKSLIVLVNGMTMLERYVKDIPGVVHELIEVSDSPLTIIYPSGKNFAAGVCAEDNSVGIRICNEQFCNALISRFRKPVVSTSANLSGAPSPANFEEIDPELVKKVDYAVRYRREDIKKFKPSPVIRVENNGVIEIIRK